MAGFAEVEVAATVAICRFAGEKRRDVAEIAVAIFSYFVGFAQAMTHWALSLCARKRPALTAINNHIVSRATGKAKRSTKLQLFALRTFLISCHGRCTPSINNLKGVLIHKDQGVTFTAFVTFLELFSVSILRRYEEANLVMF